MAEYETLVVEEKDGVAWVRMNRPDEDTNVSKGVTAGKGGGCRRDNCPSL